MRVRHYVMLMLVASWTLVGAALNVQADPKNEEERREDRGEVRKDVDKANRELRSAAEERDRELDRAYEEARREDKPEKFREKRRNILAKYDEKVGRIHEKMWEKHGEAAPLRERAFPDDRDGRAGAPARGRERVRRQDEQPVRAGERVEPRERRRAIRQIEVQIAAERRRHAGRMEDLQRLRAKARNDNDTKAVNRADTLVQRETVRHERALRRLEDRRRELAGAPGRGGLRAGLLEADGTEDVASGLDALEREIGEDEE